MVGQCPKNDLTALTFWGDPRFLIAVTLSSCGLIMSALTRNSRSSISCMPNWHLVGLSCNPAFLFFLHAAFANKSREDFVHSLLKYCRRVGEAKGKHDKLIEAWLAVLGMDSGAIGTCQ